MIALSMLLSYRERKLYERIVEFCAAMKIRLGNTRREQVNDLFTYESGPIKTQVDCYLVRTNRIKFLKGIKA